MRAIVVWGQAEGWGGGGRAEAGRRVSCHGECAVRTQLQTMEHAVGRGRRRQMRTTLLHVKKGTASCMVRNMISCSDCTVIAKGWLTEHGAMGMMTKSEHANCLHNRLYSRYWWRSQWSCFRHEIAYFGMWIWAGQHAGPGTTRLQQLHVIVCKPEISSVCSQRFLHSARLTLGHSGTKRVVDCMHRTQPCGLLVC